MKTTYSAFILAAVLLLLCTPLGAAAAGVDDAALYRIYRGRFDAVQHEEDIAENGFRAVESQIFDVEHAALGMLKIIPAIHEEYGRMALFFAGRDGSVLIKTDDFLANSWRRGSLRQTNRDIICISCVDLSGDELADIIVISSCRDDPAAGEDTAYNVGDVLFQNESGFYRDPRLSDKINRFDMNKSAEYIGAFINDGISMEFLFVANNLDELVAGGFYTINYLRISEHLEKFGLIEVVPGFYKMMGQSYLMIYIVDPNGKILWNFQPMQQNENFYDILSLSVLKDIDGDGNKDLILLARYANTDADGNSFLTTDYRIYYQRAGYFLEDTAFRQSYVYDENDDLDMVTNKARQYWGWPQ